MKELISKYAIYALLLREKLRVALHKKYSKTMQGEADTFTAKIILNLIMILKFKMYIFILLYQRFFQVQQKIIKIIKYLLLLL